MTISEIIKKYRLRAKILLKSKKSKDGDIYNVIICKKDADDIFRDCVACKGGAPNLRIVLRMYGVAFINESNDLYGYKFADWAGDDLTNELIGSDDVKREMDSKKYKVGNSMGLWSMFFGIAPQDFK